MKTRIREIHGARVTKMAVIPEDNGQTVTVSDHPSYVVLNIAGANFPAALSPEEARFIARQLCEAADRLEGSPEP